MLRPAVARALDLVDAVHGVSDLDEPWCCVPVRAVNRGSRLGRVGAYHRRVLTINSWYSTESQVSAVLHELAHHLDLLVGGGWYASERPDGPFQGFVEAASASAPAAEIRERIAWWERRQAQAGASSESERWLSDLQRAAASQSRRRQAKSSIKGFKRLLEPKELFARAYERFVVVEAASLGVGDAVALRYPPERPGLDHEQSWSETEFAPLEAALKEAFASLGWLGRQEPIRLLRPTRRVTAKVSGQLPNQQ